SYFLMSSELKGEIHEPSFYFNPEEEKAAQALDYVLMTHAWRRFDWKDVLEKERADWEQKVKFKAHQVLIKGYVNLGGQYRENVKLKIDGTDRITYTNERGYFEFKDIPRSLTDITITAKYKKHAVQVEVNPTYNFFYDDMKTMVQSTKSSSDSEALNIQKDLFGTEQVELSGQINDGNLPTRNINALAATTRGLASADEGSDISVRGSRSNSTDYYIDGIRVSGEAALVPESEVALDEVVVVGYGVSSAGLSSQLSSVDLTLIGTPASSSGNQDYDFNISIPIYQPTLNISLQNYWSKNYYYPRYFYVPRASSLRTDQRTDFRKTIFWNPNIATDANGEASIEFITSDEITTFRTILEGISNKGEIARGETTFYTELPFSIDAKLPVLLVQGDEIDIPIVVKNNTEKELIGKVVASLPKEFEVIDDQYTNFHKIAPDEFKKLNIRLRIKASVGSYPIELAFQSGMDSDQIRQVIEVVPSTFPRAAYLSANVLDKTYEFEIDNLIEGSIAAKFRAIPNVIEEMGTGVEGILREPYGCFEQVSSSNYPNILVLQLMNTRQEVDRKMRQKTYDVLGEGYKKLANYEVRGGGFSLYGKAPASVGLTAYGLVQFSELRKVYDIADQAMIDRAVNWLLSKRNSEGVFDSSNNGAYNGYGNVSNAYLIYALSTIAVEGIDKALAHETARVKKEEDLYCLALAALSNLNYGKKEIAEELIAMIERKVSKTRIEKWNTNTTLTRSYGHSKQVELASWVTLALLEAENKNIALIEKSIQFLHSKKRGAGYFGSTQATALALKTMSVYAHKFNYPSEAGKLEIYVNEVLTEARNYDENTNGIIAFNDLGQYLKQGKNSVQVRFSKTSKPLPYTLDATWQASMPELQESDIIVSTKLEQEQVRVGESVRLTATISNLADQFAPNPMAIIGIPSSLSLDVKQLKLLQEKGYFDFFEIQDNYLVLHYESLAAKEIKEVPIDLKVEFIGNFKAPVNSAFLYYQSEKKHWEEGNSITVIE
ncbi:MAG: alpha-2-macroglobulin family protein, partial [Bacteroidota bacterium]